MKGANHSAVRRRAIVVGGSKSGLFAASLLRNVAWHADVFERSDIELRGRGAGIVTHHDLIQSLERSGAQLKDLGVTVHERVALDAEGRVIDRLPYEHSHLLGSAASDHAGHDTDGHAPSWLQSEGYRAGRLFRDGDIREWRAGNWGSAGGSGWIPLDRSAPVREHEHAN
jgi:hypothetical protein